MCLSSFREIYNHSISYPFAASLHFYFIVVLAEILSFLLSKNFIYFMRKLGTVRFRGGGTEQKKKADGEKNNGSDYVKKVIRRFR